MKGATHKLYISFFLVVGILSVALLIINGFSYYSLPIEERVFSSQHYYLKPSGLLGHGLGIIGSLMMIIGVLTYMIRKRFRIFFHWGYLKYWLEFHIFLCTVGPLFVLFHTAFKFGGIVAISFWSMVVVVLSGFVGRFIYVQIPRTIQGRELDIEELNNAEEELSARLLNEFKIGGELIKKINADSLHDRYKNLSLLQSVSLFIKNFFTSKKTSNELKRILISYPGVEKKKINEILKIARAKILLSRKIGMLRTMQKLFNYWHIFHLPFALSMFIIMIIHVVVTIAFGYKWIF